jgi:hypothetical protein
LMSRLVFMASRTALLSVSLRVTRCCLSPSKTASVRAAKLGQTLIARAVYMLMTSCSLCLKALT